MKKILFLLLLITATVQGQTTLATKLKITGNLTTTTATKVNVQETDGVINTIAKSDLVDVIEVASAVNLPVTGVASKIYLTIDNNKIYRWTGAIYQELAVTDISSKVNTSLLGANNGVATLDSGGKVPLTQINDALLGSVNYKGIYDASTNTPALPIVSASNKGYYYVVSTAGTQAGLTLNAGDWIISNGTAWGKVDNNNAVTSVNTQVGAVVLTTANIADSSNKRYQTEAQQTNNNATSPIQGQLDAKAPATGSASYIQNQNTSAQSANMWISGTARFDSDLGLGLAPLTGGGAARWLTTNGTTAYGGGLISSIGGVAKAYYYSDSGFARVQGVLGEGVKLDVNAGTTALTLATTGAATFASSVTATSFNGSATLTGTPTAPTATVGTNTTQIATTAFVQGATRPYKVYTARLTQIGTNNPTVNVNENTLGGTVVWTRDSAGVYSGTLNGVFTGTPYYYISTNPGGTQLGYRLGISSDINKISIATVNNSLTSTDGILNNTSVEVRVYP